MTDRKELSQLKVLLGHVNRHLDGEAPDFVILQKLLSDALYLAEMLCEPPNPYADKALRPGLTVGEAAATGMIAPPNPDGVALRSTSHPESNDV